MVGPLYYIEEKNSVQKYIVFLLIIDCICTWNIAYRSQQGKGTTLFLGQHETLFPVKWHWLKEANPFPYLLSENVGERMLKDHLNSALKKPNFSYINNLYPIDCSLGSSTFGAPQKALEWIQQYGGKDLHKYYDYSHVVDLSLRLSEYTHVSGENIFLGNGSFNLLSILFFKFFDARRGRMLGVGPQFVDGVNEWLLSGGEYKSVGLDFSQKNGHLLPLEGLEKELGAGQYSLVYLDNPNNPTGSQFCLEDLEKLAIACEKNNTFLVLDEAYGDFLPIDQSGLSLVSRFENVIVVRSFSKGMGLAGIRLGYLLVHDSLSESMRKIMPHFSPSYLTLKIGSEVLKDLRFLDKNKRAIRKIKGDLMGIFEKHSIQTLPTHPDTPIFTAYLPGGDLHRYLRQLNITTEAGEHFTRTRADFGNEYCRVRIPEMPSDVAHIDYRLREATR